MATLLVAAAINAPAGAIAPVPLPAVALPAAIDGAAFYEKQAVCNSVARPGVLALRQMLLDTYGPATIYIERRCTRNVSEHFDGRALDWMRSVRVPAEREQAEALLAWLTAPAADGTPMEMARRLGIMYLIWNNRMIRNYDPGRGWTNYRSCQAARNSGSRMDTTCHRNHIHFSLSWDGAAGATSWWTGSALTQPYCSNASSGAVPGAGHPVVVESAAAAGVVPVTPAVVLDTASGLGLPKGPCRLLAGRTLPVDVMVPELAGTAARAVALSVTVRGSNAPGALSVWSSGRSRPAGQIPTQIGGESTTTILVPISSRGTVGLAQSLGATNLTVAVVGYLSTDLPGPAAPASFRLPAVPVPAAPPATPTATPAGTASAGPVDPPSPVPTNSGEPVQDPASGAATEPGVTPAAVVVGTKPGKPRTIRVRSARGVVTINWQTPTTSGTHPISGYRVAALFGPNQTTRVAGSCVAAADARSCTIRGLRRGKAYWMSVRATNAVGSTWAAKKRIRVR